MKRPAFMFYPADWRKDPGLRVCSIGARGLWIDMLAIMHEGEPYGHLVVNGVALSDVQLARLIGETASVVRRLLAELEQHQVFSRTDTGMIYSRRMVADEHIRNVRAASGKLGGNPKLMDKQESDEKDNQLDNQTDKQTPTPSVAVALAVAVSGEQPPPAVVSIAESELQQQAGEHYPAILRFLDQRPREKREDWARDLLGLIGPATGALPEDLARACTDGHLATPPVTNARTLRIFVRTCVRERTEPRRPANGSAPQLPVASNDAGTMFARIRGLVKTVEVIGQPTRRFIPRAEVAALGERVAAAYDAIGGADRFLNPAENVGFVLRDFTREYGTQNGAHV